MKLMWLGYLVYSLGVMKLCIETGLITHYKLKFQRYDEPNQIYETGNDTSVCN